MAGKKLLMLLALLLALVWLVVGCAEPGVLYKKQQEDGAVNRLRLDSAEGWSEYNTTPRSRSTKPKDQDGYGIVMKNEATF